MTRREWLMLVGRLGVIGAAAAVGLGSPVQAQTRPSASLNALFLNVSPRPIISSRADPRLVENILGGISSTANGYDVYRKDASSAWGDFPSSTAAITWGYDVDGGQWFQANATAGGIERVWGLITFPATIGEKYIVSFTVDSKTGTHGAAGNATFGTGTWSGTTTINNAALGRNAMIVTATSSASAQVRIGVGVGANNGATASMRFSNVMVERVPSDRTYPSEYVRPGEQAVFNYSYSATVTSGAVSAPTLGAAYTSPRRSSILMLGDSYANDPWTAATFGDFPWQTRRFLGRQQVAINAYGQSGARIDQITAQIATAVSRQSSSTPAAVPYSLCVAHGGTNDIAQSRTLAQMQAAMMEQINTILSYGMLPILVTVAPYNAASAGQQTVMDQYNAWLKTLGYPLYDLNADANDGNNDLKASWDAGDGVHLGAGFNSGAARYGQRLADLMMLIGD